MRSIIPLTLVALGSLGWSLAHGGEFRVTVTGGESPLPVAIVSTEAPAELKQGPISLADSAGKPVPVQRDGESKIVFILTDLGAGEKRELTLSNADPSTTGSVEVSEVPEGAAIKIDGELFTIYQTNNGPKPYLWPIIGPTGTTMTRAYPMEKAKGELRDHFHHRGMWFTFDKVNDTDFWAETPTSGKSKHVEFLSMTSGPVFGELTSKVDWRTRKDVPVAEDVRTYRFYRVPGARLVDVSLSMKSAEGPLKFGDSKEGLFAIRVNEQMKVERKGEHGSIMNSEGNKDGEAWGKRATWVDYFGTVDGKPVGIAMFDAPTNFRHPTYWHVRTYGLFAANPFGISQFTGDANQNGAYEVPEGKTFDATYRVYFHSGDTAEAKVAEWYAAFAHPPVCTIEPK